MKYLDRGAELYEAQHRKQQVIHLKRKVAQSALGIIEEPYEGAEEKVRFAYELRQKPTVYLDPSAYLPWPQRKPASARNEMP
jgi:hypothetical protein